VLNDWDMLSEVAVAMSVRFPLVPLGPLGSSLLVEIVLLGRSEVIEEGGRTLEISCG
jgi:hypothetical protein